MDKVKLKLEQVTAGMRLAEPVVNSSGITLMPIGIRLTPMFILRLKKWDVESVWIQKTTPSQKFSSTSEKRRRQGTTANVTPMQDEFAKAIAVEVSRWFANVRDDPLMMQLRSVAIRKLVAHGRDGVLNLMREDALRSAMESGAEEQT